MTGPKGNSEFCLPETSMFPEAKFLGETKLTVSLRASHEVFCYTSQLKTKKKLRRNRSLYAGWLINLPRFQGARLDHVQVKNSCCFSRR